MHTSVYMRKWIQRCIDIRVLLVLKNDLYFKILWCNQREGSCAMDKINKGGQGVIVGSESSIGLLKAIPINQGWADFNSLYQELVEPHLPASLVMRQKFYYNIHPFLVLSALHGGSVLSYTHFSTIPPFGKLQKLSKSNCQIAFEWPTMPMEYRRKST